MYKLPEEQLKNIFELIKTSTNSKYTFLEIETVLVALTKLEKMEDGINIEWIEEVKPIPKKEAWKEEENKV